MDVVKYGIIGFGEHAQNHMLAAKGLPLKLEAVCDVSFARQQACEEEYGCRIKKFDSERDLLRENIDAVFIATPDEKHSTSIYAALIAGKHVFAEKPLGVDDLDIKLLEYSLSFSAQQNLVLTSCHPRRFDPPFVWLKQKQKDFVEQLGKVLSFSFSFNYPAPTGEWKRRRNLLIDHISHEIDLLNFICGYAEFTSHKLYDSPLHYHVTGNRSDEIKFYFYGRREANERKYREQVSIMYEHGQVVIFADQGRARIYNSRTASDETVMIQATDYKCRLKRTLENFAHTITGKTDSYLSPFDLLLNTAMSVALSKYPRFKCINQC